MTEDGFHSTAKGYGIGILGIVDTAGVYGTGWAPIEPGHARAAGTAAVHMASGGPGTVCFRGDPLASRR